MLRFADDVSCRVFRLELARVLHHASHWAEIIGQPVTVLAIGEIEDLPPDMAPLDLAVELAIGELEAEECAGLAHYLTRILPVQYAIAVDRRVLRVAWDARRAAEENGSAARRELDPPGG